MSARSWFYTAGHDDDGNPIKKEEKLSSKQGIFDEAILRDFGSLEVEVSQGKSLSTEPHKATIAAMKKLIDQLPQHRALHWIEELERIGAIAKTGNSAKLLSESEKLAPASGKGDQGGSK
jgi:hypothetical protein